MDYPSESSPLAFWAKSKKPLLLALVAGFLAAIYTLTLPNLYRAEVRLLPVESKGSGGSLGGLASTAAAFGLSVPTGDGSDANFVDVLNSRWLREQLLNTNFNFHANYWRFGSWKLEKKRLLDFLEAKNMDQGIRALGPIYSSSRDLKSNVISISAETASPELSLAIVQQATKLLESFNREKGRTRGGAKAAFAERRLAEGRVELDEAEGAFRRFLEANRNFQASSDPSVHLRGTRLEAEFRLRQQLVASIAMNREQALLEEKNDIPILNILDPGNLPIEKSKPVRATIVLLTMMLVGTGSWIWLNRNWVREWLLARDESHIPKEHQ